MARRLETYQKDIDLRLRKQADEEAERVAKNALRLGIERAIGTKDSSVEDRLVQNRVDAGRRRLDSCTKFDKIGRDRKGWLEKADAVCVDLYRRVYARLPSLSGDETILIRPGSDRGVSCHTSAGEKYSSRCDYRKTDGHVKITLPAEDLLSLMDPSHAEVILASDRDGLPLTYIKSVGQGLFEARWLKKARGFAVEPVGGWVAFDGETAFHSTKSADHAVKGLARKKGKKDVTTSVSLKNAMNITRRMVRDATGWCGPGVQSWIESHLPAEYTRSRSVPREVVIAAAKNATDYYSVRLLDLMAE